MTIKIFNQEGLDFLGTIESNSVDLVLTDPPYITSRQTGMHKWAEHVKKQDLPGSIPAKSEQEWLDFIANPKNSLDKFFENSNVVNRQNAISCW